MYVRAPLPVVLTSVPVDVVRAGGGSLSASSFVHGAVNVRQFARADHSSRLLVNLETTYAEDHCSEPCHYVLALNIQQLTAEVAWLVCATLDAS